MSKNQKAHEIYTKPSRADIVRSIVASTAIETGKPSATIKASPEATRKKFSHLRLTI